jgi:hypothetical protein
MHAHDNMIVLSDVKSSVNWATISAILLERFFLKSLEIRFESILYFINAYFLL